MLTDGRTDGRTTDGRTTDAGVTGILIAHLGAFGSGELKSDRLLYHRQIVLPVIFFYLIWQVSYVDQEKSLS